MMEGQTGSQTAYQAMIESSLFVTLIAFFSSYFTSCLLFANMLDYTPLQIFDSNIFGVMLI